MTSNFARTAELPSRILLIAASALMIGAMHEAFAREPAPITYAVQGSATPAYATASLGLAGGGENSYGYGEARNTSPSGVIDLRPQQTARTEPARQQTEQQPWLERERVGPPYEANGQWYVPTPEPGYSETGQASWYGPDFHGRATASGEPFDQTAMTAAHPTLPIPSLVQVTNLENGREVILRVNDRGPFVGGRLIDVSRAAADVLGFQQQGGAQVHVRYLGPAPRHVASERNPRRAVAETAPAATPVVVASNGPISLLPQQPVAQSAAPAPVSYAAAAPAYGAFVVQVGAFSDAANAERVRAAVESAGPVSVDQRMTARGAVHRVRLGPWESREQAEAAQRQIASLGYAEAVVATR